MKSWKNITLALAIFPWSGCAHLATVKTMQPPLPTSIGDDERLGVAKECLAAGERAQPSTALAKDISAAELALSVLKQRPNDSAALRIYSFSVARAVENIERADLKPWQRKIDIVGDHTNYTLSTPQAIDPEHDPSRYDLIPTDTLTIAGTFFKSYLTVNGVGAPLVAVGHTETPHFRQNYGYRRVYAPITAIIRFTGRQAQLEFIDPLKTERVTLNGRRLPVAADFMRLARS